ncbi:MAG: S-layer homology domain-containing protein [Oscillospiraceae bacterium]|nr:S-layer homology domain-containing protein [Oscillospiraceae bacterium]
MKILSTIFITFLLFIILSTTAFATTYYVTEYDEIYNFTDNQAIVVKNGNYGVINNKNEILLSCVYDYIYLIDNNSYFVEKDNVIININKDEMILFTLPYDDIIHKVSDKILVISQNKYGIINTLGKELLPCKYDNIYIGESDNVLIYTNETWKLINLYSNDIIQDNIKLDTIINDFIICYDDYNKYGVMDFSGNIITPTYYDTIDTANAKSGYLIGITYNSQKIYSELISSKGVILSRPGYLGQCINGMMSWNNLNGSINYIDISGNEIINIKYSNRLLDAQPFYCDYAVIQLKNGMYTYINRSGDFVTDNIYDYAFHFINNHALVVNYKVNSLGYTYPHYMVIDKNFNIVFDLSSQNYTVVNDFFSDYMNGYIRFSTSNSEVGFLNFCDINKNTSFICQHCISFISNDSIGNMSSISNIVCNSKIPLPECTFTREGYTFTHWTDGTNIYYPGDTFVMPAHDVTMTAVWIKNSSDIDKPNTNYPFPPFFPIIDQIINKPTTDIEEPEEAYKSPYTDIIGHWAESMIDYIDELGLIDGITDTEFHPNAPMTREMFVIAMARLAGVEEDHINWAIDNGVLLGYGNGNYGLEDTVNREQMAVFFMRFFEKMDIDISELKTIEFYPFTDDEKISDWASYAVYEIQSIGLIQGKGNDVYDPQGTTTRAEAVTVIYNLIQSVLNKVG